MLLERPAVSMYASRHTLPSLNKIRTTDCRYATYETITTRLAHAQYMHHGRNGTCAPTDTRSKAKYTYRQANSIADSIN
jgi:hypothetical protein